MVEATAEIDDRRFVFLKDIDGNDAPIFVGSIVKAILGRAIPGFRALNRKETEFADRVLADAEHHHRALMHGIEGWRKHSEVEGQFFNLRNRLGLPIHVEERDHCPYLQENHPQLVLDSSGSAI